MASVVVNGESHELSDDAQGQLLGWLRGSLGLTGAKPGCGEGECGACTVILDGAPVFSCRTRLSAVSGASITTIEGLAAGGRLHPMQRALMEEGAFQCGYCTPGMALRSAALLEQDPDPNDDRIAAALGPNLCRCGCYSRIRRAVHRGAMLRRANEFENPPFEAPAETVMLPRPRRPWDLCPAEERDYFDLLGPGLVCVWPPPARAAGMWAANGGAWVHIATSGLVTAFTGKVDVGQDNRTAFRLLVAEELGAPVEAVHVVQGDTDLCPFDVGTFGSRSLPDAGEALRRAAAGARQILLELVEQRHSRPAGASTPTEVPMTAEAPVLWGPDRACLEFAELLGEVGRLEVLETEPTLLGASGRLPIARRDHQASRLDVVTGRRRYVSDLDRPRLLHGAVLRPPVPGATLLSVDLEPAARMPGVTVVEEGLFIGVTAEDPNTARQALAEVRARWDEPEPVDGDLAGYLRAHPSPGEGWERALDEATGDVEAALASAAITLEATYTTAYLAHVPLETRAALAEWDDGRLTVWTGTQVPFGVRSQVADALGMDEADVRVIVPPIGGAFGGKHGADVSLEAARLARAVGGPVKVHWSRSEELQWGYLRPLAVIDVRAGLDAAGALAAWDFLDINAGTAGLGLPYAVAARRLRYQPADSPLRQGSYRALGATANNFARESHIDELAHAWGTDPLAFRLSHLDDVRLIAVLQAAADRFGWMSGPSVGSAGSGSGSAGRVGCGLAVGLEKGGRVATGAETHIDPAGNIRVTRLVTAYECGAVVNLDTVVNQIEGAAMMALGGALFEAVPVEHGRFAQPSLGHYPVPRFRDLPEIEVVVLDRPDLPSVGAGETPMITVAPAVANAVFAATGRRLRALPLAPGGRIS
jgi:nicotinate dehydrogenase subunit B